MKTVNILSYSKDLKCFSPNIVVLQDNDDDSPLAEEIVPSDDWVREYRDWNTLGGIGHADFESLQELQDFNARGVELSRRLQKELSDNQEIVVNAFQPVLQNVSLNGKACGWWHLVDMNYEFPVNLQHIPISDELKADFRAWLIRVEKWAWLEQEDVREEMNQDAAQLQERLQAELKMAASFEKVEEDEEECKESISCDAPRAIEISN